MHEERFVNCLNSRHTKIVRWLCSLVRHLSLVLGSLCSCTSSAIDLTVVSSPTKTQTTPPLLALDAKNGNVPHIVAAEKIPTRYYVVSKLFVPLLAVLETELSILLPPEQHSNPERLC